MADVADVADDAARVNARARSVADDDDDDDAVAAAAAAKKTRARDADDATPSVIVTHGALTNMTPSCSSACSPASSRMTWKAHTASRAPVRAQPFASSSRARRVCARAEGGWLDKLNPFKKKSDSSTSIERAPSSQRAKPGELLSKEMSEELFGKGLMGKLASKAVNAAAGALKEQFESAREVTDACYDDAVRAVKLDSAVINAFGGSVECGPVISQSSSSINVNGTKQTRVGIAFQCRGANGAGAMIQAQSDGTSTTCVANFQDGRQFQVGSASSVYGDVIDVDASDVIDV